MKIKNISILTIVFLLSAKSVYAGYGYSPVTHDAPKCNNPAPGRPVITYVQNISNSKFKLASIKKESDQVALLKEIRDELKKKNK